MSRQPQLLYSIVELNWVDGVKEETRKCKPKFALSV